jgi:hypothetical protein
MARSRSLRRALIVVILLMGAPTGAHAMSDDEALSALVAAYPHVLLRHDGRSLFWRDGTVMPVHDDREAKDKEKEKEQETSFDDLLRHASVLDQFRQPYPRGYIDLPPGPNRDPGRFRNIAFFRKLYGDCSKGEVTPQLVAVTWLPKSYGKTILITKANDVAEKLTAVSKEIEALPPAIRRAAYPIAGTYVCRNVADTGAPSMHAYGAAIDLNLNFSDYWFTDQKEKGALKYRNRMPQVIVNIFESHGFIWGGKWYHYDTMHFEYRPELLGIHN